MEDIEIKTCGKCHEIKSLESFHKDKTKKDGYRPTCKKCRVRDPKTCKVQTRRWRQANKEKHRLNFQKWRKANLDSRAATQAKYRALKKSQRCKCCTDEQIKQIYKSCPNGWHVDHIYPISKGGLHCCANLQHLSAEDNLKKGANI